ncbi:MAG TPA: DCC1-like thiol-disulfide oxidoreductase family protein [Actinomycetota bacterium]
MHWVLLYESGCGFCRCSADLVLWWDRRRRLRAVPIRGEEGDRLLSGMAPDRRIATWHLRAPDGRVVSGGRAVAPMLRLLPGGRPLALAAERFPRTVERLYAFVARHRGRLGRLVGRACSVDGPRPRSRSA